MNRTLLLALASGTPLAAQQSTTFHFQCGANARHGARALGPDTIYTPERGYGFRTAPAGAREGACASDRPFFFDVALPEGNYDVTLALGDASRATNTTVRAESRRLMLAVARARNGRWIYLFRPQGDRLVSERLVDMRHHAYRPEPNVHFSPDARWVVFRANFEGDEQVYAVEVRPAAP